MQDVYELVTEGHDVPHAPQLVVLLLVSTHEPPHRTSGGMHLLHAPPEQNDPDAHLFPQAPQWLELVCRSMQAPSHLVVPTPQDTTHAPPEQTSPAPHALPHAPQLPTST
jgi:hypothetical protein